MGSIFGIDLTGDGRADFLDDIIMMNILEPETGSGKNDEDEDDD